jgi:hypothetical protein
MGNVIDRNKDGKYIVTSSVSDEQLHNEDSLSENETKKLLINQALWTFIEKAIEIDMEFPNSYGINDISPKRSGHFNAWMLANAYGENGDEILAKKFEEIYKKLNLKFNIGNDGK